MNFKKEKKVMIEAANKACRIIVRHHTKKESIKIKSNKTLVSSGDIAANKIIIMAIKQHFPNHSILSEESGFEDNKSNYKWVIDPIDGTHNFLHKIPIFGTSIALEYKSEVILGILHFPILEV